VCNMPLLPWPVGSMREWEFSHTAYFGELPTHQEFWWIINNSMQIPKAWKKFVLLGIYRTIGEIFCATHRTGYRRPPSAFSL
jgi:hypothetical protein